MAMAIRKLSLAAAVSVAEHERQPATSSQADRPHPQPLEALGRFQLATIGRSGLSRGRLASLLPSVLSGYLFVKGFQTGLPGLSCPLRALTGIPCPGCFLTRAVAASLHGDLATAVHWHPIGPVAALMLIVWSVVSIRQKRLVPAHGSGVALAGLAVLLAIAWGVRMVGRFGYGLPWFPT